MKKSFSKFLPTFLGDYSLSKKRSSGIDWVLFCATLPLLGAGLMTMSSFTGDTQLFIRQLIWISISFVIFFSLSRIDVRFLRKTWVSVSLFTISCALLGGLFALGKV